MITRREPVLRCDFVEGHIHEIVVGPRPALVEVQRRLADKPSLGDNHRAGSVFDHHVGGDRA